MSFRFSLPGFPSVGLSFFLLVVTMVVVVALAGSTSPPPPAEVGVESGNSMAAAMSGVVPILSLLGGVGFMLAYFLGVFSFFFLGMDPDAVSSSPLGRARLSIEGFVGSGTGALVPLSIGVRLRFVSLPDRPRHLSRCCATLVTTK